MSNKIIIKEHKNYILEDIEISIREIFTELNIYEILKDKKTILLKPNLLGAHHPDKAVTTHPIIVEAIIRILQEIDKEIIVGDSAGGTVKAELVWEKTGMKAVCEKYHIPLLDIGREGITTIQTEIADLHFGHTVLQCDAIINLPKMKTHSLMLYTGAVKNLFGTIPGLGKSELHKLFPSPDDFAQVLSEIYKILNPKIVLNIMDGIIGMHGEGPAAGKPYPFGIIIASEKATTVDYVAAQMMGFDIAQLKYLQYSMQMAPPPPPAPSSRGGQAPSLPPHSCSSPSLPPHSWGGQGGEEKWSNYRFQNVNIKSVLRTNTLLNKMPRFVRFVINLVFSYYPLFKKNCKMCMICVKCCPVKALSKHNNRISLDKKICIKCMCCHEMCPDSMISFKRKLW